MCVPSKWYVLDLKFKNIWVAEREEPWERDVYTMYRIQRMAKNRGMETGKINKKKSSS